MPAAWEVQLSTVGGGGGPRAGRSHWPQVTAGAGAARRHAPCGRVLPGAEHPGAAGARRGPARPPAVPAMEPGRPVPSRVKKVRSTCTPSGRVRSSSRPPSAIHLRARQAAATCGARQEHGPACSQPCGPAPRPPPYRGGRPARVTAVQRPAAGAQARGARRAGAPKEPRSPKTCLCPSPRPTAGGTHRCTSSAGMPRAKSMRHAPWTPAPRLARRPARQR
jgi:translation initiation factor IF-2